MTNVAVLGAPGSGKTSASAALRELLADYVVLDWDSLLEAAGRLAGADVRSEPALWPAYQGLVRGVVEAVAPHPVVLLTVCTPTELQGWPINAWMLLDCADDERSERLVNRLHAADVDEAVRDAARDRSLGLPVVDATGRSPTDVAAELARRIVALARG